MQHRPAPSNANPLFGDDMRDVALLIATSDPYHLLAVGYVFGCVFAFVGMLAVRWSRRDD